MPHTQTNSQWIKDMRTQTVSLLGENAGAITHDFELSNGFLGVPPKAQAAKEKH